MNGAHDLGGMHGFGPVEPEENEPVFHDDWERSVFTMIRVGGAQFWNIDEFRHAIERMGNARYLDTTYYEHWLAALEMLLVEKGVMDADELESRTGQPVARPDASPTASPAVAGEAAQRAENRRGFRRESAEPPRFAPGDQVTTGNTNPKGHTRLPRYARGKRGVVERVHGVFVYPDTNAHGLGEQPQAVYSVRFDARELWGDSAEDRGSVNIDLWESYLVPT